MYSNDLQSLSSFLYVNTYCANCTQSTRNFESLGAYSTITKSSYPVISASFFDLGEDGTLDIIVNVAGDSSNPSTLQTYMNNLK